MRFRILSRRVKVASLKRRTTRDDFLLRGVNPLYPLFWPSLGVFSFSYSSMIVTRLFVFYYFMFFYFLIIYESSDMDSLVIRDDVYRYS